MVMLPVDLRLLELVSSAPPTVSDIINLSCL